MRHAITIDDKLMQLLESRAKAAGETLDVVADRAMRLGLFAEETSTKNSNPPEQDKSTAEANDVTVASKVPFVQRSFAMGKPLIDMNKALSIADEWDDEERIRKMEEQTAEYERAKRKNPSQ